MTFAARRAFAVSVFAGALSIGLLFIPSTARAGCVADCEAVRSLGLTVAPPLSCLVEASAPDARTCQCEVGYAYRNDCADALEIVEQNPASDPGCRGCAPPKTRFEKGEVFSFDVGVRVPITQSGAPYTKGASRTFVITEQNAARATHTLEAKVEADIDPESGGCSLARRHASRTGAIVALFGVLALVLAVRRRVAPATP